MNSIEKQNLLERLRSLELQHIKLNQELVLLRKDILNTNIASGVKEEINLQKPSVQIGGSQKPQQNILEDRVTSSLPNFKTSVAKPKPKPKQVSLSDELEQVTKQTDFEKFIGENLINKIGILVIVIGVAIGAKYSIENNLINPLTRIIMGYVMGLGLLGVGMKLKQNYTNYSAVLVSGAMCIMYFITFSAHSFYNLFPLSVAFILMLFFTVFTVISALKYDKQVIAIVGQVGAYAVPFLLSSGSGSVKLLFSYMLLINMGILVVAVKKYWKLLYYSAFGFTWIIVVGWLFNQNTNKVFVMAISFSFLFFIIFYMTALAYKIINKEQFVKSDVVLILANSFCFFTLGYYILSSHDTAQDYMGFFAVANALIHFGVSGYLYKLQLADKKLFYLIMGLVLIFLTLAIPIQLDGNWVTLLWILEASLLLWIGKTKGVSFYEKMAYPLLLISLLSFCQDSVATRYDSSTMMAIFNGYFAHKLVYMISLGFLYWVSKKEIHQKEASAKHSLFTLLDKAIPVFLILIVYTSFYSEIAVYFEGLQHDTRILNQTVEGSMTSYTYNHQYNRYQSLWQILYSLLFVTGLGFLNHKRYQSNSFKIAVLVAHLFFFVLFLTDGLYTLSNLRTDYIAQTASLFVLGWEAIAIRYVAILIVLLTSYKLYSWYIKTSENTQLKKKVLIAIHLPILWVVSSELIHWMAMLGIEETYKLGLSILWGLYALFLVAYGILKRSKALRIFGILLFAVTLLKLFLYDISHLNTISKTIVFVALGILLLIISFLYNKFKDRITDETIN